MAGEGKGIACCSPRQAQALKKQNYARIRVWDSLSVGENIRQRIHLSAFTRRLPPGVLVKAPTP